MVIVILVSDSVMVSGCQIVNGISDSQQTFAE